MDSSMKVYNCMKLFYRFLNENQITVNQLTMNWIYKWKSYLKNHYYELSILEED